MNFNELKQVMTDISPQKDGRVLKRIIKAGAEQTSQLEVPENARVQIHYKLEVEVQTVEEEEEIIGRHEIHNSWSKGKAELHKIGRGARLISSGLEFAIRTMSKGEKAEFLIDGPGFPWERPSFLATVELMNFIEETKAKAMSALTFHRLGRAKMQNKEFTQALRLLLHARRLTPQDDSVMEDVKKLGQELEQMGLNVFDLGLSLWDFRISMDPEQQEQEYEEVCQYVAYMDLEIFNIF